jgi:putative intracellular protease/amidase
LENGPHAGQARRLIQEALAAKRLVAALGMGPRVLATAGVLEGVRATCYQYGQPPKFHVKTLQKLGAIYVDEPAVADGLIITGRNPSDCMAFVRELAKQLEVE